VLIAQLLRGPQPATNLLAAGFLAARVAQPGVLPRGLVNAAQRLLVSRIGCGAIGLFVLAA